MQFFKKKMIIAIEKYPFVFNEKIGPYIFLERLSKELQKKTKLTNKFDPFYNFALFANTNKSFYNKPFFIRIGGIFFDNNHTITDTFASNKKIFDSIFETDFDWVLRQRQRPGCRSFVAHKPSRR